MAAPRWTIRNYNVFLREARREYDLSLPEARLLYREVRDWKVGAAYGADVERYKDALYDEPQLVVDSMLYGIDVFEPEPSDVFGAAGEYPADFMLEAGAELELTAQTYTEKD